MLPSQYVAQGWTQHQTARDEFGQSIKPCDANARSWDILGALIASHNNGTISLQQSDLIKQHINNNLCMHFLTWNDMKDRQQEEVISVLQCAEQELCLA